MAYLVTERADVHSIQSPQTIPVECSTTQGDLHITVQPTWSPLGAARFLELVRKEYFDGCALNRVVKGFLTQFGISADYEQRTSYRQKNIPDDIIIPNTPLFLVRMARKSTNNSYPTSLIRFVFVVN